MAAAFSAPQRSATRSGRVGNGGNSPSRSPAARGPGRVSGLRWACSGSSLSGSPPAPIPAPAEAGGCGRGASARLISAENTPCASLLGPPASSGKPVAITACGGVSSRSACASISRSTIRTLASPGRICLVALSISASRSVSQRKVSPAIARASARSGALWTSPSAEVSACSSVSPRRSTASRRRKAERRTGSPGVADIGRS